MTLITVKLLHQNSTQSTNAQEGLSRLIVFKCFKKMPGHTESIPFALKFGREFPFIFDKTVKF